MNHAAPLDGKCDAQFRRVQIRIMQHELKSYLVAVVILPSVCLCICILPFLTTNCYGMSRWHNDWSVSVTNDNNILLMVWKWEVWLCHQQPQWSGPQGIQMVSTWSPSCSSIRGRAIGREGREREREGNMEKYSGTWRECKCACWCMCGFILFAARRIHERKKWREVVNIGKASKQGGDSIAAI